jgi:hypothetical protein
MLSTHRAPRPHSRSRFAHRVVACVTIALSPAACADAHTGPASRDVSPPDLKAWVNGYEFSTPSPLARMNLQSRDTLTIVFDVQDTDGLEWAGLRFGGNSPISDSIQISGTAVRVTGRFLMEGAPFDTFTVRAFARNRARKISEVIPTLGRVTVYARGTPTAVRELPVETTTRLAVDWRGNRLILAYGEWERGPTNITSLDLRTLERRTVATVPGFVQDLDVVPSGDSIVATVDNHNAFYVVPVAQAGVIERVPLQVDVAAFRGARSIRVTDANVALVSVARPAPNDAERLITVNLSTGEQRLRTDAFENRDTYRHIPLVASPDRHRVVAAGSSSDTCCRAHIYEGRTDRFIVAGPATKGTLQSVFGLVGLALSVDGTHSIDEQLTAYDATLQSRGTLMFPGPRGGDEGSPIDAGGLAISADGSIAYVGHGNGILAVRLADGAVLERDALPLTRVLPYRFLPTGDILVVAEGRFWAVTPHRVGSVISPAPARSTIVRSTMSQTAGMTWSPWQHR